MASGIASTESGPSPKGPKPKGPAGKLVDYDRFIDGQLRRTRGQVKVVEIAHGLSNLAVGTLVFFLLAVALDHWVFRGGLGYFGRFVLFAALVIGAAYYFALTVLPALVRRVNPVYAAQTIERAKPSLKNSLINFLLFRRQREAVPQLIYNALEEQAAAGLVQVPIDTAVDRTQVIHRGYALVALAAVFAIYFVISPKNPLVTIERLMLPWADIAAPARVSISDIQPGSAYAFRGVPLKVSAEIVGLPSGEQAKLLYTTADRQSVDRAIPMTVPPDGYRYTATLPEGDGGVQQDLQYHIVAGDAVSNTYRITAVAMPTIVVDSVDYHYPDYTGMEPISIKHRGDLKALEGTQVTVACGGESADPFGLDRFQLRRQAGPWAESGRSEGDGEFHAVAEQFAHGGAVRQLSVAVYERSERAKSAAGAAHGGSGARSAAGGDVPGAGARGSRRAGEWERDAGGAGDRSGFCAGERGDTGENGTRRRDWMRRPANC